MALFWKDIFRTIKGSLGRFISIAAIIALGIGIFIGLNVSSPDMKRSMSEYLKQNYTYDLRVSCSYGLDEASLDVIKNVEGVEAAQLATSADTKISVNDCEAAFIAYSLPKGTLEFDGESSERIINSLLLKDGRWPEAADECVVIADTKLGVPINIGDNISIKKSVMSVEQVFVNNAFKVVGIVYSPTCISANMIGYSTVTEGTVTGAIYVPEKSFVSTYPMTDCYVKVAGADKFLSQLAQYDNCVNPVKEKIDSVLPDIAQIRLSAIQSQLEQKINAGQQEIDRNLQEMNTKFADGLQQLNDALALLDAGSGGIKYGEQELQNAQNTFNKYKDVIYTGINKLLDTLMQSIEVCNQTNREFNSSNSKLNEYWANIQKSLDHAMNAYLPASEICDAQVDYCKHAINNISASPLPEAEKLALISAIYDYQHTTGLISTACINAHNSIEHATSHHEKMKLYEDSIVQLSRLFQTHGVQVQTMNAVFGQINLRLNDELVVIYKYQAQLDALLNQYQQKIDQSVRALASKKAELDSGYLQQQAGMSSYNASKADAEAKIAQAQQKLNEGKNTIEAMARPQLFLMDRHMNMGYVSYYKNSDSIAKIALVFPLFLLIIAALVSMSTMTRMVEEERTRLGTCKALGYSKRYISARFVTYGAISAVIGAVFGILVFAQLLPVIIIFSYNMMFSIPVFCTEYNFLMFVVGCALGILITCGVTVLTVYKTTHEVPAQLMRPPSPKEGKTILLEKIKPFWSRLSFLWKISFRNIFLYKKRLIMTLIGIAGCTALIVTAFGLTDTINECITYQMERVATESMMVTLPQDSGKMTEQHNIIDGNSEVSTNIQTTSLMIKSWDGDDQMVTLTAAHDADSMDKMRPLHNRITGEKYSFSKKYKDDPESIDLDSGKTSKITYLDSGIMLSEKLAKITDLKVGDTAKFTKQSLTGTSSDEVLEFSVVGITECYFGHYAYVNFDEYQAKVDPNVAYNKYLIKTSGEQADKQIMSELKATDDDVSISYNADFEKTMRETLKSVQLVVVILIICAALLAFVVIYNLTNINISERLGELATLKVLGNTNNEVNSYVHRETIVLTFIGSLLGLVIGWALVSVVVLTTETDIMMMGRDITAFSYIISVVLTVVFTLIVIATMRKKIKNINMIESLKSVE